MPTISNEMIIGDWVWDDQNSEETEMSRIALIEAIQVHGWGRG